MYVQFSRRNPRWLFIVKLQTLMEKGKKKQPILNFFVNNEKGLKNLTARMISVTVIKYKFIGGSGIAMSKQNFP